MATLPVGKDDDTRTQAAQSRGQLETILVGVLNVAVGQVKGFAMRDAEDASGFCSFGGALGCGAAGSGFALGEIDAVLVSRLARGGRAGSADEGPRLQTRRATPQRGRHRNGINGVGARHRAGHVEDAVYGRRADINEIERRRGDGRRYRQNRRHR